MSEKMKSFIVRCKMYFGLKPNQGLKEFSAEVNTLTDKDKAELIAEFNAMGMPTQLKMVQ